MKNNRQSVAEGTGLGLVDLVLVSDNCNGTSLKITNPIFYSILILKSVPSIKYPLFIVEKSVSLDFRIETPPQFSITLALESYSEGASVIENAAVESIRVILNKKIGFVILNCNYNCLKTGPYTSNYFQKSGTNRLISLITLMVSIK